MLPLSRGHFYSVGVTITKEDFDPAKAGVQPPARETTIAQKFELLWAQFKNFISGHLKEEAQSHFRDLCIAQKNYNGAHQPEDKLKYREEAMNAFNALKRLVPNCDEYFKVSNPTAPTETDSSKISIQITLPSELGVVTPPLFSMNVEPFGNEEANKYWGKIAGCFDDSHRFWALDIVARMFESGNRNATQYQKLFAELETIGKINDLPLELQFFDEEHRYWEKIERCFEGANKAEARGILHKMLTPGEGPVSTGAEAIHARMVAFAKLGNLAKEGSKSVFEVRINGLSTSGRVNVGFYMKGLAFPGGSSLSDEALINTITGPEIRPGQLSFSNIDKLPKDFMFLISHYEKAFAAGRAALKTLRVRIAPIFTRNKVLRGIAHIHKASIVEMMQSHANSMACLATGENVKIRDLNLVLTNIKKNVGGSFTREEAGKAQSYLDRLSKKNIPDSCNYKVAVKEAGDFIEGTVTIQRVLGDREHEVS